MTPAKPNWQKILQWFSPLLLVSLGLHGIAMVIPVPDKEEIVEEPDVELPEPISVTELPPGIEPEPEPEPEPVFVPAPPPPAVIAPPPPEPPPEPPPVVQPPAVVELPPEPELPPELEPEPETIPEPETNFEPEPEVNSSSKPTKPPTMPQAYTPGDGRAERDLRTQFFTIYGVPESIEMPLTLNYPADGKCYENETPLTVQVLVSIDKYGNVSADTEDNDIIVIAKTSGYADIDQWITDQSIFGLPPEAFASMEGSDNVDIVDWLRNAYSSQTSDPFVPQDQEQAPFAFTANVTIQDNQCGGSAQ